LEPGIKAGSGGGLSAGGVAVAFGKMIGALLVLGITTRSGVAVGSGLGEAWASGRLAGKAVASTGLWVR